MSLVEIPNGVRLNAIQYLGKLVRRCEAVMNNPAKYSNQARARAGKTYNIIYPLLEALKNPIKSTIEAQEKIKQEKEDLASKLKSLEADLENLKVIVKKLVAYHEGEV